jgi:plastocyanin
LFSRALTSLLAALGVAVIVTAPGAAAKPETHTVTIEATAFSPANLTVHIGDSIVWTNKDPYPHSATSKSGGFDSDNIMPGRSWKYVAKKKGDFPYICSIHPSMKGTLHVK